MQYAKTTIPTIADSIMISITDRMIRAMVFMTFFIVLRPLAFGVDANYYEDW